MTFFRWIVMVVCALTLAMPHDADAAKKRTKKKAPKKVTQQVLGEEDPRYAALIMDPETGEILHSRNARAQRYPASLTKMMTLYILFEEIAAGEIDLDDSFRVSQYATTQPQTHISLDEGDRVPVETAIKALVVRSANDVSVVVAENIAGSVSRFADRMNATARKLGMTGSHFENPNGLPNDEQVTTAMDMAKLGIALKRDFPQFYHYFSTREFSWNGVNYYTHNRVMLRYSGTDGIKTGYIGKSGFNLVTSVARGGRPLIGVVLGGSSGRWRDDKMIALLGDGYTTLAERGGKRSAVFASNLPKPIKEPEMPVEVAANETPVQGGTVEVEAQTAEKTPPAPPVQRSLGEGGSPQPLAPSIKWGIQIGAYMNKQQAENAAKQALQLSKLAAIKGVKVKAAAAAKQAVIHRARLENLSLEQAKQACSTLKVNNMPCFIYQPGTQNL